MKTRVFFWLAFLAAVGRCQAQFFIEGGYRTGIWLNTAGINGIIKDYNDTRQWLSSPMPDVHFGHSVRVVIGTQGHRSNPVGYTFTVEVLRSTPVAHGVEPGTSHEAYRKIIFHYGGFGFGVNAGGSDKHHDLLVGMDFKFNYVAVRTMYAHNPDFKDAETTEIANPFRPAVQFYSRLGLFAGPFGIGVTPYLELPIVTEKYALIDLGRELNGGHTSEKTNWWPASIGLSGTIILCPAHGRD